MAQSPTLIEAIVTLDNCCDEPMIRNEMATQDIYFFAAWNTLVVKDIQVKFGFKLISFLCKPYDFKSHG